ncbi:rhodanese-related sulfurtransferase [Candidatus Phytoplasma pini]|uniref:tRNA uridine(34) hydroxylase n=1 Tax=Candidatus Phytoplasma pini TaxID=267362 RepID=A0A559KJU0_9MOLU|nr:rhodanese-related sulfurtransferase [Candidatus Phytoplasma pini]TVY12396.1 Rhodanese-like protein [Candidatus Phytoplasma pini]
MSEINEKNYSVILYYKYIRIINPEEFKKQHFDYCKKINLVGRVIVSFEGINGTLSGLQENINQYISFMQKQKDFNDINFQIEHVTKNVFRKLSIKFKEEIVSLKLDKDLFPPDVSKNYLKPKEFYQLLQEKNVLVLDVRNNYEYSLGHFQNAINPDINNFRDLPYWLEKNLDILKNKKILTYCTGGVRCEKISAFLKIKGIDEVYQLKGGIVAYSQDKEIKGQLFNGKVYVFDQRIVSEANHQKHVIVGKDFFDQTPCERYINCANPICNKQILCSEENEHKYLGSCSIKCRQHYLNRYKLRNISTNDFTKIS